MFEKYTPTSTGGGFVAYVRDVGNVRIILTCATDESRLPEQGDAVDVDFFHATTGARCIHENMDASEHSNLSQDQAETLIKTFLDTYPGN